MKESSVILASQFIELFYKNNMYKLYYNHKAIGDVLLIVFHEEIMPDLIIHNGDVTSLYKNKELVGINIFNFSKIARIFHEGEIVQPATEFLELINHILINANLDPLKEE